MSLRFSDLLLVPSPDAIEELRVSWNWLLPEVWTPVLFSIFGDLFFEDEAKHVRWLNTGVGEITEVANGEAHFLEALKGEAQSWWFLPELVAKLRSAGKIPEADQCYSFTTFPVFAQGKYEVSNIYLIEARQHFAFSGYLHSQIQDLPDGSKVDIAVQR